MKEPTKADLAAAVARLTEENEALRDLLAAAAAYAEVPHPASYVGSRPYEYELERRADAIAIWANGDREDMAPGVYVLVIQDRAKHLREEAARPVRYEVKAAPAPETCGADGSDGKGIILCTLPPGHEGRHERHHETGVTHWPSAANPPRYVRPGTVKRCYARDGGYSCNSQAGHDGPEHVAYGPSGEECHRWPVTVADVARTEHAAVAS